MMNKPNFFLIGAPKCGTTSVFSYIIQHPDVYKSLVKETHFFKDDHQLKLGYTYYLDKYFSGAGLFAARGEATPAYLPLADKVAPRLKDFVGSENVKFLVILRNPVDRAWSNYLHRVKNRSETLSFQEAIFDEERRRAANEPIFSRYVEQGFYAKQLVKWFEYFPKENFKILYYEDLGEVQGFMESVFDFLELDAAAPLDYSGRKNVAAVERSKILTRIVYGYPRLKRTFFNFIIPQHYRKLVRYKIGQLMSKPIEKSKREVIDPVMAEYLRDAYKEDLVELSELIGPRCLQWR